MKVITFSSFKGGTGKTTLSMNVASYLAEKKNKKVLLIDLDPQANLTTYVGFVKEDLFLSSNLFQTESSSGDLVRKTKVCNLDIITSNISIELFRDKINDEKLFFSGSLKKVLMDLDYYDVCVIDTPPSLGFLVEEAFSVSDGVVACLSPEPFAVLGFHKIVEFLELFPKKNIELIGVVISFWESRNSTNSLYVKNINKVSKRESIPCFTIRKDINFSRSILKEKPIFSSYPKSRAIEDITQFSDFLFDWIFSCSFKTC